MSWHLENITVRYSSTLALDNVDIAIEPGVVHGIIGGDGAGKSTLLKVMAGLNLGQSGRINLPPQKEIGYVPSEGGMFGELTVEENMEFVADVYRLKGWRPRATMLLERGSLQAFGERIAGRMSGGQRRKLAGAMALLPEPRLVVLDEVTTGVDPVSRMELWRLIAGAAASGAAVVAATTYIDEAERAGSVLVMHGGRTLAAGAPADVVAAATGAVTDVDEPSNRRLAWRRGRRWRQWDPQGNPTGAALSLEDAAIMLELGQEQPLP